MGHDDTYRLPRDIEPRADSASWLAPRHTEVDQAASEHAPTGQQRVTVGPRLSHQRGPGDGVQSGAFGQVFHLARVRRALRVRADLLQTDQLRIETAEYARDTRDVTTTIPADALVDIVGHRRKHLGALCRCYIRAISHTLTHVW